MPESDKIIELRALIQRRLFRLATDTKLEMAHSMCLAMSRELKVGNQERFTAMVLDKHENLRRTVESKREGFLADMDAAYTNAERYAHRPWLMDRAVRTRGSHREAASRSKARERDVRRLADEQLRRTRRGRSWRLQCPRAEGSCCSASGR